MAVRGPGCRHAVECGSGLPTEVCAGERAPLTRGLNRNHHPLLKSAFKGAANVAAAQDGPLKEYYEACAGRGVREEMAKLTLARKIVAIVLRLWKSGEVLDATKLKMQDSSSQNLAYRPTYHCQPA